LDKLEAFASEHGPRFYGLPLNDGTVTLERRPVEVPDGLGLGSIELVPFLAGSELEWSLAE
jgi:dihydroorotase